MNKEKAISKFNFITNILILSLLIFGGFIWADNNGVWTLASDIRGGIFGNDEQPNSDFEFINRVKFNNEVNLINNTIYKGTELENLFVNENQINSINSEMIIDGTINIIDMNSSQIQKRIINTCNTGESIKTINSDGTVVCESTGGSPGEIRVPTGLYGSCFQAETIPATTQNCYFGSYCFGIDAPPVYGCTLYGDPLTCDSSHMCQCPTGFVKIKQGDGEDNAGMLGSYYSCLMDGIIYPPLYNNEHTEKDCTNLGGIVVNYDGQILCEFTHSTTGVSFESRCSSKGFTAYNTVVQSASHKCTSWIVNSYPCTPYCTATGSSSWHSYTQAFCNGVEVTGTETINYCVSPRSYGVDQCFTYCSNSHAAPSPRICNSYVTKARCY